MAGRQAKVLSDAQQRAVLSFLETTRHPTRNKVIFLLSAKAGLRAMEIASITWSAVLDAEGCLTDSITIMDREAKRQGGRTIPMNRQLVVALSDLKDEANPKASDNIVRTERARRTSPGTIVHLFRDWYHRLGFIGASSHSGRRTFITNAARKISTVGGSLRDVQALAGHRSLAVTQAYIETHAEARRRVVDLV